MKFRWLARLGAGLGVLVLAGAATPAFAQLRGVPSGAPTSTPLALSLGEAIRRGLAQNLSIILEEQQLKDAESTRLLALSEVLPQVSGSVRQSRQVLSTAAFGFTLPGLPSLIGPFSLLDARLSVSSPLFDARAIAGLRGGEALVRAGQADVREVRESVVLAVGMLYLQAEADAARVETSRAQVATAEALVTLAEDQRTAGLVAGIDVVRQQVQLQSARARLIVAENDFEKRKLTLARAIGLPAGQLFDLSDAPGFLPAPATSLDAAVGEAAAHREDLKAARARFEAAQAGRRAAVAGHFPSLSLEADFGAIGPARSELERTYSIAALVHVPIFDGGTTRARVKRADAQVQQRQAELADLEGGLRYDVQAAMLDVSAAEAGVTVADGARTLAQEELQQAQDRFRAGITSSLELVQAQESVAAATEHYIASVYAHTVAKAALARATGQVEQQFVALVGGQP